MAEYHLLTIWRIEAPLQDVYAAIEDSLRWPDWWPSVRKVEQLADGNAKGIGSVRRYAWQGRLPYRVVFDVRATRIEQNIAIEGIATGDLDGSGRWKFSSQGKLSVVHYEWHVHSRRWWMNLVAPVARTIFVRNHAQIMVQGGKALAKRLRARLVGQENTDLMAPAVKSGVGQVAAPARSRAERL
ncbi:MAG: SRPBCC family protein [Sulfuritalea sp.]|nr:SRPBCC family protein [Sulfuritalea sp.]